MIIQKEIRNLIRDIAEEFNLPFETAREIIYSQFKYVRKELEKGVKNEPETFKNILLKYLGTFYATEAKINYYKNKAKRNAKRN